MAAARLGVIIVPAVVFLLLSALNFVDAFFVYQRWRPIGQSVVSWTRNYPIWLFLLAGLFGAMIGHFFTKPPVGWH